MNLNKEQYFANNLGRKYIPAVGVVSMLPPPTHVPVVSTPLRLFGFNLNITLFKSAKFCRFKFTALFQMDVDYYKELNKYIKKCLEKINAWAYLDERKLYSIEMKLAYSVY